MIISFEGKKPQINPEAFIAESATLIGEVIVMKNASIWYNVVLRGDIAPIIIGEDTSVQDGSVIHCSAGMPTRVGNKVTIGHQVVLHACQIEDHSLIGIGAIVLDGAKVGEYSVIGAGALVTPGTQVPPRTMMMGIPARVVRTLTDEEILEIENHGKGYVELIKKYTINLSS